jgi:hypothetical protein
MLKEVPLVDHTNISIDDDKIENFESFRRGRRES